MRGICLLENIVNLEEHELARRKKEHNGFVAVF